MSSESSAPSRMGRRGLLRSLIVGGAAAAVGTATLGGGRTGPWPDPDPKIGFGRPLDPAVHAWLGAIGVGTVAAGATVRGVYGPAHGAISFLLAEAGALFQIDVVRHDTSAATSTPAPVARAAEHDFYLVNDGDGSAATVESHASAARALAAALVAGSREGAAPPLLTFAERAERFGGGAFAIPLHGQA